jgi:hypothetical protein
MAKFLKLWVHRLALRPNRKANHLLASFKGQNRRLNNLMVTEELCKRTVKLNLTVF